MEILITIAEGIHRVIKESENPENLPRNALLLFQRFKHAYEDKNISELADTISDNFWGKIYDVYPTKQDFLNVMEHDLKKIKYGKPFVRITVFNVTEDTPSSFVCIINIKASLKILGIPTPFKFNSEKLLCETQPEPPYNYWRIRKLEAIG